MRTQIRLPSNDSPCISCLCTQCCSVEQCTTAPVSATPSCRSLVSYGDFALPVWPGYEQFYVYIYTRQCRTRAVKLPNTPTMDYSNGCGLESASEITCPGLRATEELLLSRHIVLLTPFIVLLCIVEMLHLISLQFVPAISVHVTNK
ncbi:hypothetical protein AMELA_G00201400 [Ameiurus melas]|uniref:Uncharacterized protein n=1 Tax=Ameiurus melas TaxID=219545 RepID=A0A7J6A777_AMEME|nr:hypothetical protein AMELA_G00201400 [Ameiurus melas]